MAPTLGYWNIRGLATPVRLMLEQAGVEYKERLYKVGPPPEMDKSDWTNEKSTLGLDFPNLPYYIDGDVKLTQSHVIMRYLARKHNLYGKDNVEQSKADMIAATVYDFHMDYARMIAYNPDHEKNKEAYQTNLTARLELLVKYLGDKKFFVGDTVTYADFVVYEYLEGQALYNKDVLKNYPTLAQFVERVNELPAVKNYFNSDRAIKLPFNGGPAFIGGPYSDILSKK